MLSKKKKKKIYNIKIQRIEETETTRSITGSGEKIRM
jgi:hypothetical protein